MLMGLCPRTRRAPKLEAVQKVSAPSLLTRVAASLRQTTKSSTSSLCHPSTRTVTCWSPRLAPWTTSSSEVSCRLSRTTSHKMITVMSRSWSSISMSCLTKNSRSFSIMSKNVISRTMKTRKRPSRRSSLGSRSRSWWMRSHRPILTSRCSTNSSSSNRSRLSRATNNLHPKLSRLWMLMQIETWDLIS